MITDVNYTLLNPDYQSDLEVASFAFLTVEGERLPAEPIVCGPGSFTVSLRMDRDRILVGLASLVPKGSGWETIMSGEPTTFRAGQCAIVLVEAVQGPEGAAA